jgi:hypothetical protein
MNNIQLTILLDKYRVMLANALAEAERELPEGLRETTKNLLGQEGFEIPALNSVYQVLNCLSDDVELLKNSEEKVK